MTQCANFSNSTCIGSNGSCQHYHSGCLRAKKDREDAERDQKNSNGEKSSGKIGFWGWAFIILIAAYFIGQK
jgi:hypothetical protein